MSIGERVSIRGMLAVVCILFDAGFVYLFTKHLLLLNDVGAAIIVMGCHRSHDQLQLVRS